MSDTVSIDKDDALWLTGYFDEDEHRLSPIRRFIEAVREQTRPPKPPEPTGLGAVVEDEYGHKFIRVQTDYSSPWIQHGYATVLYKYEHLHVVRVLSEGVPA